MTDATHPNMSTLMKLDIRNLDACASIFADDFMWHYFNRKLPGIEGDYQGVKGLKTFFAKLGEKSRGNFNVNLVDARPVGDELVVTQVCNHLALDGEEIEFDAVVVWRIVDGKVAEAWDIPAVNTVRAVQSA